jgi:hypothetical protein
MNKLVAVFFLLISTSSIADEWTTADKQRETVYLMLHAIDWAQTRTIARNPDKYAEGGIIASRIIGGHPSVGQVDSYMIGSALMVSFVSRALPSEYRRVFQYVTIGDSAYSVGRNFSIDIWIGF